MSDGTDISASPEAAAIHAAAAPAIFFGLTLGQALVMVAWPLLLFSGLYMFLLVKKQDVELLEVAVRARPSIKVVDVTEVMRNNIAKGMTADQSITEANRVFQKLGRAGYIVIDRNAVLASPKSVELK